jgi:hypothetical protein
VVGWFDMKVYDATHDAEKAQGWTPLVLDTNGDGKRGPYTEANQPADPAKATAEITANWEEFFAPTTPEATAQSLLQNADKLQQALAIAAKAKASGNKTSAKVKGVTFTSPTEATVTYDLLVNGAVALAGSTGKAVLEGGTWKVSQVTFCTLVALSANGQPVPGC